MKFFVNILCTIGLLAVANSKTIPEFPKPCHTSDPDIRGCYANMFNKLKNYISTGIPEFNIRSLDPLVEDEIRAKRVIGLLTMDAIAKNFNLQGLSNLVIDNFKLDKDGVLTEIDVTVPRLHNTFDFKLSTTAAGSAPMKFQGSVSGDLTDFKMHADLRFKKTEKNGVKYFVLESFKPKVTIGNARTQLLTKNHENHENQAMVDFMMNSFNENPKPYLEMLAPIFSKLMEDAVGSTIAHAFEEIPADRFLIE